MDAQVAAKITQFFDKYPKRSYPKGQILVFADESPEHIYHLIKGKVRMYDVSYRGDEVIVNIFKPPAFFPMSWAINQVDNKYFYKTEEPTELHTVPHTDVVEFVKANPDVMFDLLSRVYLGMEGLLGKVVHLMSGTAKSRLLHELLIECHRFGKKQANGDYLLSTTETDIAARSGLSRETVSREIHKLKEKDLISIEQGGILVRNLGALKKLQSSES
ncbi:MAG: Crp/Fnr family transcriptional regulator [Candidatus Saccharimonadales bacterium]